MESGTDNKRSIVKNVTKTFLHECVNISEKDGIFNGLQIDKLKTQKKKRYANRKVGFKADPLKIKVKLKKDGEYVTFAKNNENGSLVRDSKGNTAVYDYVEETIIYQNNGSIRLNLSKIAYKLQEYFWFTTVSSLLNLKFENEFFKESYKLTLIPEENTFEIEPVSRVDIDNLGNIQLSYDDTKNLIKIIGKLTADNRFKIEAKGHGESKERPNKIVNAGQWKNASEFVETERGISNCIYYLASDNFEESPAKMYIGEATVSGVRLCTRKIDGVTYIGHSERSREFTDYRFTRYRIDEVSTWDAMHDAQDAMIGAFSMADFNDFPNGFVLTNKFYNKAYSVAVNEKNSKKK